MNIHWDLEQNTDEWFVARCGLVSASSFDQIFTPTGKQATGAKVTNYANKLIAERLMGKAAESGHSSAAMERGQEFEEQARLWYEMAHNCDVEQVGIVGNDNVSCSPDGLVTFDREQNTIQKGLEIKCPLAHTQIAYLLKGELPTNYIPQVQGSMYVTGASEWDFLSYHPDLDPLLITVKRDDEWIDDFITVLNPFVKKILDGVAMLSDTKKAA